MKTSSFVFTFPDEKKLRETNPLKIGSTPFHLEMTGGQVEQARLLDTFTEEVRKSGKLLLSIDDRLLLFDWASGDIFEQTVDYFWSFLSELKNGPVRDNLGGVSEIRAISPVAGLKIRRDKGLVLDDEIKTRVRLLFFSFRRKKKTLLFGVTRPLRGYEKSHGKVISWLLAEGAQKTGDSLTVYTKLAIPVRNYSVKPRLPISGTDDIKKSVTAIIRTSLTVAELNEPGILADIDTEFLHDYRVSFRKIRSALSLFKGVYGRGKTARLKREFSELMKKTNRLRDLDVYLLDRQRYFSLVPESSHEGLEILFSRLQRERKQEYRNFCRLLKSRSYKKDMDTWKNMFNDADHLPDGPHGKKVSSAFAAERILKRYEKVCAIARSIDDQTEDAVVHELRIECKKLRYLMEFSIPLFGGKKIKKLIRSLKRLQDNLGRFNDYSVQQHLPASFLEGKMKRSREEIKMAEAIGALTAMLYQLQCRERSLVMENFAEFDNKKVHAAFYELFEPQVKGLPE
ncbi:CHAD domain-containing protein [Desulfomarina sp.]